MARVSCVLWSGNGGCLRQEGGSAFAAGLVNVPTEVAGFVHIGQTEKHLSRINAASS